MKHDERSLNSAAFLGFIRLVIAGDVEEVSGRVRASPTLATVAAPFGASRRGPQRFFFTPIKHYLYEGDTALHMAAAAFRRPVAEVLVSHGADYRARNRRGAEPLHYAADANHSAPDAQAEVIAYLTSIGANPNTLDKSGVAPLHRAVRTRSLSAVRALLDGGADPRLRNKSGSTPLHLAVQNTGRSGSGSADAHRQQAGIIKLLFERGAQPADTDARGKKWIRTQFPDFAGGV